MDANSVFPSKHLKATDIGERRPLVQIESIAIETLGQGEDQDKKPVIYFSGKDKGLVCNKTNWNTLIDLYGPETDRWIGQKIQLCTAPVDFRGKMTMALRIIPSKSTPPAPVQAHPPAKEYVQGDEPEMADQDIEF